MLDAVMTGSETDEPAADSHPAPFARASSLFQFVQTRAPQPGIRSGSDELPRVKTYFPDDQTVFHSRLAAMRTNGHAAGMLSEAGRFAESADRATWDGAVFRGRRDTLPEWLSDFDTALRERHDRPSVAALEKALVAALEGDGDLVADGRLRWGAFADSMISSWHDIGDSVIAVSLWPAASAASQADLVRAMRVIALLNRILDADLDEDAELADVLSVDDIETTLVEALVLLPADVFAQDKPPSPGNGRRPIRRREPVVEEGGEEPAEAAPQRSSLRRGVDALSQAVRTAMHHHEGRIPDVGEVMDYLPRE